MKGSSLRALIFTLLIATAGLAFHFLLPGKWLEVLDHAGIVLGFVALCLSGGAAAMALLNPQRFRQRLQALFRSSFHRNQKLDPDQAQHWLKGVVIPVSRYEQPAWILHHLKPRAAALVFTDDPRSKDAAVRIQKDFRDQVTFLNAPLDQPCSRPLQVDRPHDPTDTRQLARHFIDELQRQGYPRKALAVDTTGGTVPMSLGLFQAAAEKGVRALYIVGNEENDRGALVIQHPEKREAGTAILVSGQEAGSGG